MKRSTGIMGGIGAGILAAATLAAVADNGTGKQAAPVMASQEAAEVAADDVATTITVEVATSLPPSTTPTTAGDDELTGPQRQAVRAAESYLEWGGFSREGLIKQLEFEQFTTADATAAVDSMTVDWAAQAVVSAKGYIEWSGWSCPGLIDQLEYEGFSTELATHGATGAGIC